MCIELPIRLQIDIGLHRTRRNDVADLRPNADDTRLEWAQLRNTTFIGANLLVEVTDRANEQLFGQELRRAAIQMPIDAALIIGALIDEIVGETR